MATLKPVTGAGLNSKNKNAINANFKALNEEIAEGSGGSDPLKADLVGGKVPAEQLPSYVDDVIEAAAIAAFPVTGETGKIYIDLTDNKTYRWSGSTYVEISPSTAPTLDSVMEAGATASITGLKSITTAVSGGQALTEVDTVDVGMGTTLRKEFGSKLTNNFCDYAKFHLESGDRMGMFLNEAVMEAIYQTTPGSGESPEARVIARSTNFGGASSQLVVYNNAGNKSIACSTSNTNGISVNDSIHNKGLYGASYYGANYDDNTYVQRKYVWTEKTMTFTSAQILNSFTAPLTLVDPPGAGMAIIVQSVMLSMNYNTTAYLGDTAMRVKYTGGSTIATFPLLLGAIASGVNFKNNLFEDVYLNAGLELVTDTGNPITGDSPVKCTVWYKVVTL